ncbi:hypothetical protein [Mycolicibacterium hodleri]|uniref:Uncharacterized protein n=1 Tax=Mycolicibacterium hodleri TaxID=49897 RepID=A0A502E3W0_9MYCO|nr:hypothetical protein [Mycolicibacterium hodleri]TPG31120.1 hypothetical protein EAH80_24160 [Mycolicibacterium hodleri]
MVVTDDPSRNRECDLVLQPSIGIIGVRVVERNSLTVNAIRPIGVGAVLRSIAVATARKAWASMARVVQRYQERQRRTWC